MDWKELLVRIGDGSRAGDRHLVTSGPPILRLCCQLGYDSPPIRRRWLRWLTTSSPMLRCWRSSVSSAPREQANWRRMMVLSIRGSADQRISGSVRSILLRGSRPLPWCRTIHHTVPRSGRSKSARESHQGSQIPERLSDRYTVHVLDRAAESQGNQTPTYQSSGTPHPCTLPQQDACGRTSPDRRP
jgi:hypothetical protein